MKKRYILYFFILLFNTCTIKKDLEPPYPEFTTEGKNVAACKINGKEWIVENHGIISIEYLRSKYLLSFMFGHNLKNKFQDDIGIELSRSKPITENSYVLSDDNGTLNYAIAGYGITLNNYGTDSIYKGNLEIIKFDTINNIISGKFNFQAKNTKTSEVLNITDGIFDSRFMNDY